MPDPYYGEDEGFATCLEIIERGVDGLLDALETAGMGCISFAPLAQGLLTGKYLAGIPEGSRASQGKSLDPDLLSDEMVRRLRGLDAIARGRDQSLAQLALAWVLRGGRVTSALVGASSPKQIEDSVGTIANLDFDAEELARIEAIVKA